MKKKSNNRKKEVVRKISKLIYLIIATCYLLTALGCKNPFFPEKKEKKRSSNPFIEMVTIPGEFPVTFSMGQTGVATPVHEVTLTKSFSISKHQVTQKQWEVVMGTTIQDQEAFTGWGLYGVGDKHPMYHVNWYEAVEFCNELSLLEGLDPAYDIDKDTPDPNNNHSGDSIKWTVTLIEDSNGYRLPTEAQWEYACRAGSETLYFWGDSTDEASDHAWYYTNSSDGTKEVGTKDPNEWGLYDMTGNVWEWCWDWYGAYTDTAKEDPTGASSGSVRVMRGGSWYDSVGNLQSAGRNNIIPYYRYDSFGFRVARP